MRATLDAYGRIDTVVANAGYDTLDAGDPAGWGDMVLTNVLGPALLIHYALPALKETRGRIVLIGSVAGVVYTPGNIYGATKWAVTGLAENTRRMVTADGVGVTLVAPRTGGDRLLGCRGRRTSGGHQPHRGPDRRLGGVGRAPARRRRHQLRRRPPGRPDGLTLGRYNARPAWAPWTRGAHAGERRAGEGGRHRPCPCHRPPALLSPSPP